jgi:tRNA(Ile2) C34 agmatinyltransferase TiaS
MPLLLAILGLSVLLYLWVSRRHSTLTRTCRWRLDTSLGSGGYRCAACGATTRTDGRPPRDCLRPDRSTLP